MARTLNRLTDRKVRTARAGMYADGGGLWLRVDGDSDSLNRRWVFRYATGAGIKGANGKRRSKERQMGLGPVNDVTLAEARERAAECRKLRQQGKDPITEKDAVRAAHVLAAAHALTFDQCCAAYIEAHRAGWKNEKHAAQWPSTLRKYASPAFGALPVAAVDQTLVLKAVEPIWKTKPETANRLRGRIEAVLDWARARGHRDGENPARWKGHLDKLLPARSKVKRVEHHPALGYRDIPAFMAELRERPGKSAVALEFVILNASRTSEVINARHAEIDQRAKTWVIPAGRMKAAKEHRVPLASQSLDIIKQQKSGGAEFIFPGRKPGTALSNMAMAELLKDMGRDDITVHGFRSTFRDWAAEQTHYPDQVIEAALAHVVGNKTKAAYFRSDLFEKRRELMADWAAYCGQKRKVAK
jgi:integrase